MKKFKDFLLDENYSNGFQGAGLSSSTIPYDVDDAEIKNRINAVLGHTAISEFLNPFAAVQHIEMKLGQLGMSRVSIPSEDPRSENPDEVEFAENSGSFTVRFNRYGEIMGKSVDTPMDEIEKEEKNYDLKIKYQKLENNSYKVYGELV